MCLSIGFTAREGCPFPKEIEGWKTMSSENGYSFWSTIRGSGPYIRSYWYRAKDKHIRLNFSCLTKKVDTGDCVIEETHKYKAGFHVYLRKPPYISGEHVVKVILKDITAIGQQDDEPCAVGRRMMILGEEK